MTPKRTRAPGTARVQAALRAEGWRVSPVAGDLGQWTLVALDPDDGLLLVLIVRAEPARSTMVELLAVPCHPTWAREIWIPEDRGRQYRRLRLPRLPALAFRGRDRCDACGAPLGERKSLSGLCPPCEKPAIEETVVRIQKQRKASRC